MLFTVQFLLSVYLVLCYLLFNSYCLFITVYFNLSICLQLKSYPQSMPVYLVLCYLLFNCYCLFITVYFNLSICLQLKSSCL